MRIIYVSIFAVGQLTTVLLASFPHFWEKNETLFLWVWHNLHTKYQTILDTIFAMKMQRYLQWKSQTIWGHQKTKYTLAMSIELFKKNQEPYFQQSILPCNTLRHGNSILICWSLKLTILEHPQWKEPANTYKTYKICIYVIPTYSIVSDIGRRQNWRKRNLDKTWSSYLKFGFSCSKIGWSGVFYNFTFWLCSTTGVFYNFTMLLYSTSKVFFYLQFYNFTLQHNRREQSVLLQNEGRLPQVKQLIIKL